MKRITTFFALFLATIFCSLVCFGCSELQEYAASFVKGEYTVTLDFNNGKADKEITVKAGSTLQTPQDPEKENYVFLGWYTNEAFTEKYDFSKAVYYNFHLHARYEIDAESVVNEITTSVIHSLVKIYNKSYSNSFMGQVSSIQQGSGVCFHIQDGYYYVLTNCHVVKTNESYAIQSLTVEDYQGNEYEGHLYRNPTLSTEAVAAEYDLACLYFYAKETNVKSLSFADNPEKGESVVSMGAPLGQDNAITFGKVNGYKKIQVDNSENLATNVTFDVIEHTAFINNGSSGGPLLNADLEIVGINYAGLNAENVQVNRGYAVPAQKVKEFLNIYVYNR